MCYITKMSISFGAPRLFAVTTKSGVLDSKAIAPSEGLLGMLVIRRAPPAAPDEKTFIEKLALADPADLEKAAELLDATDFTATSARAALHAALRIVDVGDGSSFDCTTRWPADLAPLVASQLLACLVTDAREHFEDAFAELEGAGRACAIGLLAPNVYDEAAAASAAAARAEFATDVAKFTRTLQARGWTIDKSSPGPDPAVVPKAAAGTPPPVDAAPLAALKALVLIQSQLEGRLSRKMAHAKTKGAIDPALAAGADAGGLYDFLRAHLTASEVMDLQHGALAAASRKRSHEAISAFGASDEMPHPKASPQEIDESMRAQKRPGGAMGGKNDYHRLLGDCSSSASTLPHSAPPGTPMPDRYVAPKSMLRPAFFLIDRAEMDEAPQEEMVQAVGANGAAVWRRSTKTAKPKPLPAPLDLMIGGFRLGCHCMAYRDWSSGDVFAHLQFLIKITELHTKSGYPWAAVALLEDKYRLKMHIEEFTSWNDPTALSTLMSTTMAAPTAQRSAGRAASGGGRKATITVKGTQRFCDGVPVCSNWNNGFPCKRGTDCTYKHVCSFCASDKHPSKDCSDAPAAAAKP